MVYYFYMSNRKHVIAFVSVFILFLFIHTRAVFAATIFVDGTLSGTCSGSYSIANRTCTGTDGNAYNTLSGGVGAATAGDTVNIRGGTYNISSAVNVPFSSSTLTTTIQGYNSETVNIANSNVGAITFNLSSSATKNVLFKNLNLTGTQYYVITGWSNYSGNVWTATIPYSTTQVRFDTTTGTSVGSIAAVISAN